MNEAWSLPHDWIVPAWPRPAKVRALMTTRNGGISRGAWGGANGGGMNLGTGSGDDLDAVARNRAMLASHLPGQPAWLQQVHGAAVVDAAAVPAGTRADASFSVLPGVVCAILVADCMPVLFTDRSGSRVAAAHAGWRGLVGGVLEATLSASGLRPDETLAWIGPAIGPSRFEVGDDVRDAFLAAADADAASVAACFRPHVAGKWWADLPGLARRRLAVLGVDAVFASGLCTASDAQRFYSYRRDGLTGRMAALIWIDH
jgi:YfiH family protein